MTAFTRYADVHKSPSGPGDARPTAQQIIDDEGLRGTLSDKTILITGASSGLGVETARVLATTGARLFLTVRNLAKGRAVVEDILKGVAGLDASRVQLIEMDQCSLESVRKAVAEFEGQSERLHVLINNAGIAACSQQTTKDGFEMQFGTNHLSHFLLFQLLKPILLKSSTPSFQSRVINVSSLAHRMGSVHFGDYDLTETGYEPFKAYAQSKTANIWMANELERRYGHRGLHGLSLHPGGIRTGLMDSHDPDIRVMVESILSTEAVAKTVKSVEQGSATTVLAAVGTAFEGKGGLYLDDCSVATLGPSDPMSAAPGFATWAYDEDGEKRLWKDSLKLVGLEDDDKD